jgi:carbamoyltransferase
MRILGLSCFYHDSAAALVDDGRVVAAAQEERFSRKRHDSGFPANAVRYCLDQAGGGVDYVALYEKPLLKFERLLETYLAFAPRGLASFSMAMPAWSRDKLFQRKTIVESLARVEAKTDWASRLLFTEHHLSHAASAFYPSPFERAAVLTLDGVGEWATTSVARGDGHSLDIYKEIHFPHSLGLLYSAFTYYTGFRVNSGEYKLMGLAPYGEPRYVDRIRDHLIDVKPDGSFRLNLDYFNYCTGLTMTNGKFASLFGQPARVPEAELTPFHMDVAASVQAVLDDVLLKLTRSIAAETGMRNLCLAGGVALNCVANGRVLRDGAFERIWIQPAAGDAGGALGAALAVHHQMQGQTKDPATVVASNGDGHGAGHVARGCEARGGRGAADGMQGALLGPAFAQADIEARLRAAGAVFTRLSREALYDRAVEAMERGQALGWFQGRMEFGPRALGARSILADPRSPSMQSLLNLKVKFRESFRPFAPAVRREDVAEYFELETDSPYMLLVADVQRARRRPMTAEESTRFGIARLNAVRSDIPAVTHVDYSARVQTVHADTNPAFHALLSRFKARTGCAVLVNTSFNVRGEPIVCTPEDAYRCFMGTAIEALAIGDCFLAKDDQPKALNASYHHTLARD